MGKFPQYIAKQNKIFIQHVDHPYYINIDT